MAVAAAIYRFKSAIPVPDAMHGMTMLVALTLSSYAQQLFALDSEHGFERYRLSPLRGWQVLLAKDLAFLLILMVLVLPLASLAGLTAGLVLLALGHRPSVLVPERQLWWCFVARARGWSGVFQVVVMFVAGRVAFRSTSLVLIPCMALYLGSLVYYGELFERH